MMRLFSGADAHLRPRPLRPSRSLGLAALLLLAGCEEEILPHVSNDGVFSINGFLDPVADTQWVRVTHFRNTILTNPGPVDAMVTLEHLGTGRVVEMQQTVVTFPSPNFPGENVYGHNFWTDEPIERGATYRLRATRSDGEEATAVVKIPRGLIDTTVRVSMNARGQSSTVHVDVDIPDGDHLTFLSFDHHRKYPHPCSAIPIDRILYPLFGERPSGPGSYGWSPIERRGGPNDDPTCDTARYVRWTASIILSGERWPFGEGDFVGYLGQGSNVENGMGHLGGIVWEEVPVPICVFAGPGAPNLCELFFGPESATLEVQVRDSDGTLLRVQSDPLNQRPLTVHLSKAGESWYRTGDDPRSFGAFLDYLPHVPLDRVRFTGLLPGEYRITFPGHQVPGTSTIRTYCEERTIVLAPGEHRIVEIQAKVRPPIPDEPLNENECRVG